MTNDVDLIQTSDSRPSVNVGHLNFMSEMAGVMHRQVSLIEHAIDGMRTLQFELEKSEKNKKGFESKRGQEVLKEIAKNSSRPEPVDSRP